jgi:transcriptional regulator with XRE-family HTH domain
MTSREAFGSRLRHHREQLGITVESIAQTTKIGRPLISALERGDLSRWPRGIYRRSFLRGYARATGLPAEPLVVEALRLFPEPGQPPPAEDERRLRLTLAPEPRWPARARQCLAAALDTGAILLAGYGLSAVSAAGFWPATACAAASYYAAGTIVLGQSLSAWILAAALQAGARPATFLEQIAALRDGWLQDLLKTGMRSEPREPREEAVAFGRSLR